MKRIFVQLVSYRDPECHHTLTDLFSRAAHPERISVGLCWQYDPAEDAAMLAVPYPRADQVKTVEYHVKDAAGAGWARSEAQKFYAGEDYVLQIQAHHRFEDGWDETLIHMLESLPSKKAILTAWLPDYQPPNFKEPLENNLPVACLNRLGDAEDAQLIHLIKRIVPRAGHEPFPTAMWVGNFMFTHAQTLRDVPFDPHIYFWGEELNYSARLWTHGYDIYHLPKIVLYHHWNRKGVKDGAEYRDHQSRRNHLSLLRNLHLLGFAETDEQEALVDLEHCALGNERSLDDYFSFIGVNWEEGTIAEHARLGIFRPRIFISIASFRDPELNPTIEDILGKAADPTRIRFGICQQLIPIEDDEHITLSAPQIKVTRVDASESKGANWARAEAMKLHAGEEYILQIDSHMRFAEGWDEKLIHMLARCPSEKVAITAYLPNYTPPNTLDESPGHILRMAVRRLGDEDDAQLVHLTGLFIPQDSSQAGLCQTPFTIMNFMFAKAEVWKRVPIDPNIYFYGDEISMSARLYTNGIDLYQPDENVCYHYWARHEELTKHPYRRLKTPAAAATLARIKHLLSRGAGFGEYGLGSERSLEEFWEYSGVDLTTRQISDNALQGLWRDTKDKPRIFVQIASYRDKECQYTVKDLFDKAKYPERISVGICWQFIPGEDDACFEIPYPYPEQVRVIEADARESKGACWARSQVQTLYQGEAFTLQIDAHMRFEPGWDEALLSMWRQCQSPKAVLSTYAARYTFEGEIDRQNVPRLAAKHFSDQGILHLHGISHDRVEGDISLPLPGAFVSGHMLFGPGSLIKDVPYDPYLYFYGEEISLAARLWTHGYDIFNPNRSVVFHHYVKPETKDQHKTHFADHTNWLDRDLLSFARVRHLFETEKSTDPKVLAEIEKYGFGKERTLAEYEQYSGVDFKKKTISRNANAGFFIRPGSGILVRIAAYRDAECQHTVKDLFEKARHPERIRVAICWQYDPIEDADLLKITERGDQVHILTIDWRETGGVCWARAKTEELLKDEAYTLQIDSHMRFVPNWDELLIEELNRCPSSKAVLSSSPAHYVPPDVLEPNPRATIRRVLPFLPSGNIRGRGEMLEVAPTAPLLGAFVAAGFMFSRADVIREVPYDPHLYFDQEEIMLALRLYTHGWDVFSPHKHYLYHYYNTPDSGRPLHWVDMKKDNETRMRSLAGRALARFNHLTGYKQSNDPVVLTEIEKYGLGKARSLKDFEQFTGIDFKHKIAHPKALEAKFIPGLEQYRTIPITDTLKPTRPPVESRFDIGDQFPHFMFEETSGKMRSLDTKAMEPQLIFFLPFSAPEKNAEHIRHMAGLMKEPFPVTFLMDAPIGEITSYYNALQLPLPLAADPGGRIGNIIGATYAGAYVLGKNLQVKHVLRNLPPKELAETAFKLLMEHKAEQKPASPYITETAPVLIMPEIFSKEFCQKLIDIFHSGPSTNRGVGMKGYAPEVKRRQDHIVGEELRAELDLKLSRAVFAQIERVFGFPVFARENYRIGLYRGEDEGFFHTHRDNYDEPMGYRRVAMTVNLSGDYEGGGLIFPEFGQQIYRPTQGSAIFFPASIQHEATAVTKGERYVLVGFFHSAEDEMFRQHQRMNQKAPIEALEFRPELHDVNGAPRARDFFRRWRARN